MSKIQNSDVKGTADLTSDARLINDTKIYVTANALNKRLDQAITDGDIGGGGAIALATYQYDTTNGYGSTDTMIRRWTNQTITPVDSSGLLSVTNTAANGMKIEALKKCVVTVSITDGANASGQRSGLSKNSNQLTTGVVSITAAHRVTNDFLSDANAEMQVCATVALEIGDILRPHGDGSAASSNSSFCGIFISAFGIFSGSSVISAWTTYTPTFGAGFGTVTNQSFFYRTIADSNGALDIDIKGFFETGTVSGGAGSISMPGSCTTDTSRTPIVSSRAIVGSSNNSSGSGGDPIFEANKGCVVVVDSSDYSKLFFANNSASDASGGVTNLANGNTFLNTGSQIYINSSISVTGTP